jgi:3-oxoacyl-[acyl-carrier protein] reductase
MFMSAVAHQSAASVHPELAGARVLITGLTSTSGVDIARGFAEHKARLVIQSPEATPEMTVLTALLAEKAAEIKLFSDPFASPEDAVRLAQSAAREFGGLDVVINLASLEPAALRSDASPAEIEAFVADALLGAALMTRVAANRMRLTWIEGTILNVVAVAEPPRGFATVLVDIVRTTLAAMTRGEALQWAAQGIRINAAGPCGPGTGLSSGADVAALALYLASKKGKGLTGYVFDAAGVAEGRCA